MTRAIAFASFVLLLPLTYCNALSMVAHPRHSVLEIIFLDWRGTLILVFIGGPLMFVAGHVIWFACRAFNFAMRKMT